MRPSSWKSRLWLNQSTHSRVNWFEVVESTPWSPVADQFGLVEADDRLGHGVIEAVASGSDRGHRSVLGEPFGVTDSEVLGGFNWWSQHLEDGGVVGWLASRSGWRRFGRCAASSGRQIGRA